jgi:prepilin-type N-terminal cleavage/methylation domain-containing protein
MKLFRAEVQRGRRTSEADGPVGGFTLLEVLVASAIFFICAFAVLELLSQGLASARALQQREPDIGILAAAYSLTNANQVEEGTESGNFEDIAPGLYPGYTWVRDVYEVGSNGLYRVDFVVIHDRGRKGGVSESHLSVLKYAPGAKKGLGGGGGRGNIFGGK